MYSAEKGRTVSTKTARPAETEERTRDRVLQGVLTHGPVSAAKLGELLNLTPAAVRRHLDALEKNNLIEVASHRQHGAGAGRPARRYVIAPQGHSELGNDYLDIARDALTMLKDAVGEDALRQFASARANDMAERYRPIVEAAGDDVSARAEALAEAMTHDGFVATANEMAPAVGMRSKLPDNLLASIQLCQGHCPVRDLAEDFSVFCDQETEIISELLGVDVRRLSTMAGGAHVCTTHIPLGRPPASAPPNPEETPGDTAP
ncbi:MAG TPA: MarR family transcriptional regulator [Candidatus Rothia avistercoris]|uniref:MarR family transcriptional regulator n=1 Tax=Candidatus Rothia avistercoris TaxID=2840479 RepID=A0A9D2ZS76_9MICC|nr:MarR family transcriptional regulator [Candidatus Rothia avistercoris]